VYLFLPSIETGGVERNAILVANYLTGRDIKVTVVYTRAIEKIKKRFDPNVTFKQLGGTLRVPGIHPRISDAIVIFFGFISLLRQQPKEEKSVILSFQSNIVSIIASKFSSVPVIARVSNHPSHVKYESGKIQKLAERLKRIVYRYADAVITNSDVTSEYFRQLLPVYVETIYNPINVPQVKEQSGIEVHHPWLVDKKSLIVVAVGRLATQKNFPLLIKAFSHVILDVDARLIILGEGSERGKLEELIARLKLSERVALLGYEKNVHRYVARSDLFVLSSNFEGLPNALIEAIATGVPVVSTDCLSGPAEILDGGKGGALVPVDDDVALADAIIDSLMNKGDTLKKQEHAKAKLSEFEHSKIMKRYEAILRKISNG
jgi:glycosyltransferase involved in cell wall biosynthesis